MQLPDLPNFNDASIEEVAIGPRREITLVVQLMPRLNGALRSLAMQVRFGGIINFSEVRDFFAVPHYQSSEIGSIRYSPENHSKSGHLYLEFIYERVDAEIVIECSNISIQYPEQPAT